MDQKNQASGDYAIEIEKLGKTYKASGRQPEKQALIEADLKIRKGSIFALLGPNGAGKSTMINIMAGLVTKSSGLVRIWGNDIDVNERAAKSSIGVVPQEINYDPFFTPRQLLDLQAGLYGVPKDRRRVMEILDMVGLADKADAYTRSLSGGMRRRLMVAKAMMHSPPILVLDEPTAGVDIELRKQLWDNVREMNAKGVTILLTTHYLEEAEELCDEIAIINKGRIVASEDKETLLSRIDSKSIRFRLNREFDRVPEPIAAIGGQKAGKRSVIIHYRPADTQVGALIETIQKTGYGIADISTAESNLEDVFLQLVNSQSE